MTGPCPPVLRDHARTRRFAPIAVIAGRRRDPDRRRRRRSSCRPVTSGTPSDQPTARAGTGHRAAGDAVAHGRPGRGLPGDRRGQTTAAAVEAAVADAGAGTVCFPAGRYEGSVRRRPSPARHGDSRKAPSSPAPSAIKAPDVWIGGGTIELPTEDQWAEGISVNADRATIQGVTFQGGGLVVSIHGLDGTQVLDSQLQRPVRDGDLHLGRGSRRGRHADRGQHDRRDVRPGRPRRSRSRGAEETAEGVVNQRITVRGNKIDQGDETTGWFGVELKLSPEAVIVDNDIRGGGVLISLPDSDGVDRQRQPARPARQRRAGASRSPRATT